MPSPAHSSDQSQKGTHRSAAPTTFAASPDQIPEPDTISKCDGPPENELQQSTEPTQRLSLQNEDDHCEQLPRSRLARPLRRLIQWFKPHVSREKSLDHFVRTIQLQLQDQKGQKVMKPLQAKLDTGSPINILSLKVVDMFDLPLKVDEGHEALKTLGNYSWRSIRKVKGRIRSSTAMNLNSWILSSSQGFVYTCIYPLSCIYIL